MIVVTTILTAVDESGAQELFRVATHADTGAVVVAIAQNAEDAIAQFREAMDL